jgi:hypothetical protein
MIITANKYILVFIAAFTAVSFVSAQSQLKIKGKVTNSYNEPLEYVNVYVFNTFDGAMTDKDGKFSFTTQSRDSIIIIASLIGYSTEEKELAEYNSGKAEIDIVLRETGVELSEAVVTGSSFSSEEEKGIRVSPLDVYTTPGGAADIFQSLKTLPGLTQVSESAELYVRGGDPSETITMVDQATLYHPFTFESSYGGIFSNLNTESFRSLYFSSGGFSVKYGNALSGVLDIETKNEPDFLNITAGISMAAVSLSGAIPVMEDRLGLLFSAKQSYTGPIMWLNGELDRFTAAPASRNLTGSLIYRYSETGRIKIYSMYSDDSQGVNIEQAEFSGSFNGNSANRLYNIQQSDILFSNIFFKNSVSVNVFQYNWKLGVLDLRTRDNVTTFRSDIEVTPNRKTRLNLGFEIEKRENGYSGKVPSLDYDMRPEAEAMSLNTLLSENRTGVYFELVKSGFTGINDLFIKAGLRFDFLSNHNLEWLNPRITVGYHLDSNSSITAGAGLFSQMPDLRLMNKVVGNPSIGEMSAFHYTLSYELNFTDNKSLRTEFYYKDYRDLPLENTALNYTNDGYGFAYGFDFILKGSLPAGLEGWISYGFINTKRKWMDNKELTSSDFDVTNNLSLVLKYYLTSMLQIGINYKYATGRPFTPVVGSEYIPQLAIYKPKYGVKNSGRYKNYQRLDLRITYLSQLYGKYFTVLYVEALNILDFRNLFGYTYSFDYKETKGVVSYFGRRTIVFGAQIRF